MPVIASGPTCARPGCRRPDWKDGLCNRCWRLAHLFGRDPRLFAYEPLDGFRDPRDSPALPWEQWERQAADRGVSVADMLAGRQPGAPER